MKISKITTDQYDSVTYSLMCLGQLRNCLEIWSLQIVRKRIWPCTAGYDASDANSDVVNSNSTFAQSVVNELSVRKVR
jgi:hypothetical protein